jgi:hypothetical protein
MKPSILHADVADIAGFSVVSTTTEPTKIIQYEHQCRFKVQVLHCDKGSNLDCGIVKETMAQLGIGHEPLPTAKHDRPVEATIRPLREEVMMTLRLIASRWGTTPLGEWLSGILTQAGVMNDYRTTMTGDDGWSPASRAQARREGGNNRARDAMHGEGAA